MRLANHKGSPMCPYLAFPTVIVTAQMMFAVRIGAARVHVWPEAVGAERVEQQRARHPHGPRPGCRPASPAGAREGQGL